MGIQKQDLRIGNYVNVPRKEQSPFRVDYFDNVKVYQDNGTYECTPIGEIPMHPLTWDLADIEGIPLTPEILIKCGFVKRRDREYLYSIDLHKHISIVDGKDRFFAMLLQDAEFSGGELSVFCCNEIKYLHQLQNLIFSISGEELEVKL